MACDSCWDDNGTQVVSAIKIQRLASGALLGMAGDNDGRAIVALLDKVKDPKKLPTRAQIAETKTACSALIAFIKGGVWVISSGRVDEAGWPDKEDDEDLGVWPAGSMGGYCAIGSGSDVALGAMDAGADAKRAVEIACRRNINCRLPVHVVPLFDKSHPNPYKGRRK
jgi:hypothetical protein